MIGRLRDWLRRLVGRGAAESADEPADEPDADAATDLECAVCGTAVEKPEATCPLCGSGDVVPADRPENGDGGPGPAEVRETDATDEAAARLREVRDRQDGGPD